MFTARTAETANQADSLRDEHTLDYVVPDSVAIAYAKLPPLRAFLHAEQDPVSFMILNQHFCRLLAFSCAELWPSLSSRPSLSMVLACYNIRLGGVYDKS